MIKKAELYKTIFDEKRIVPSGLPEIAVVGRSNAGKSSLINKLCNNGKLARVSGEPGRTRSINYFLINGELMLVDLPGYGFARRSKGEQEKWKRLVEGYLGSGGDLKLLLLLCDIRHDASSGDIMISEYLKYYDIPYIMVATKSDKVAKSKQKIAAGKIASQLSADKYICFSALDGTGREELTELLLGY